ncbi:GTPase HflX, partial [Candidatus Gracilibacteria bacterium]
SEAKLQIELASIKHMGPRIFDMGMELGKQAGKGRGETNTQIMKRHLQRREKAIKKELEHFSKVRKEHRKSRSRKGLATIGVVGYTNAGKSTLTNALTNKGVLAEDKLFATLGTSVGKMWIAPSSLDEGKYCPGKEFLINDTIGFIRDLPPELIDAFTSTLEDSIEADILLHTVDACDPKLEEKIEVVDEILERIGATQKKIYVFNKIDGISCCHSGLDPESNINIEKYTRRDSERDPEMNSEGQTIEIDYLEYLKEKFAKYNPVFVSAYKKVGLDELKERIMMESQ